jgi:Spy/CpxP family protein refolding chaperone
MGIHAMTFKSEENRSQVTFFKNPYWHVMLVEELVNGAVIWTAIAKQNDAVNVPFATAFKHPGVNVFRAATIINHGLSICEESIAAIKDDMSDIITTTAELLCQASKKRSDWTLKQERLGHVARLRFRHQGTMFQNASVRQRQITQCTITVYWLL